MAADEPENLVLKMLVEMRSEMREQFSALDAKISTLDAKFTSRFELVEARLSRLEQNVEGLSASIEFVIKQLRVLLTHDPERIDKLEERVAALERAMISGS